MWTVDDVATILADLKPGEKVNVAVRTTTRQGSTIPSRSANTPRAERFAGRARPSRGTDSRGGGFIAAPSACQLSAHARRRDRLQAVIRFTFRGR